ncbi:MAG: transcriptional regulator [Methanosphaera sp.]|nr:transcriptional regulator [Methanosphaera sp.]
MISRDNILEDIKLLLSTYGYTTSNIYDRICFDMIARHDNSLLIIKVLVNIDSLTSQQAEELSKVAGTFLASPLLVGLKNNYSPLEEDIVYERHDIPAISPQTLCNMIVNETNPEIFTKRGGYYVKINGQLLKKLREKQHLSLKELADLSHVSRETIYKYEQGNSQAYPETALMIEEILNSPITLPFDIDDIELLNTGLDKTIMEPEELIKLGYDIKSSNKTPFDAVSQRQIEQKKLEKLKKQLDIQLDEVEKLKKQIEKQSKKTDLLITNMEKNQNDKKLSKIANQTEDISKITDHNAIFILDHEKNNEFIKKIPAIYRWELKDMDEIEDLLKLIEERKQKAEES